MQGYADNSDSCSNELVYFISGFLVLVIQLLLIGLLKRSRYLASLGDKQASYVLVLPIYYVMVVYLVVLGIAVGIDDMFGFQDSQVIAVAVKWGLYRFSSESLAVFLMHNAVGAKAVTRSVIIGGTWAAISTIVPLLLFLLGGWHSYLIGATVLILLLDVFYIVMWWTPEHVLHRRPALQLFAKFFSIGLTMFAAAHLLLYFRDDFRLPCLIEVIIVFADLLQPLVIYYVMHQDSQFWQGLYCGGDSGLTMSSSNLNQPLLGVYELGRETIGVLSETLSSLESHVVPIVPFGVLKIDTSGYFSGGSARVYKGVHRQDEVAVKILFCIELTPERVISFCNEASVLHALKHTNIVECIGVAVMPPAICLVTEWCHHGSLYDLLHTSEYFIRDSSFNGRQSYLSVGKARNSHRQSNFSFRMSNTSSADEEGDEDGRGSRSSHLSTNSTSVNLRDAVALLEEGAHAGATTSSSGPSTGECSSRTDPSSSRSIKSSRFSRKSKSTLHSSMRVVVDPANETISEVESSVMYSQDDSEPIETAVITKLKSAATVMQSHVMGFGFGPSDAVRSGKPDACNKRTVSTASSSVHAGDLLVSGDPTRQSLGFCLPMRLRLQMIRDCCAGVAFLHSKGLMHCDIKSLNFLVTKEFTVKLADLGEARPFKNIPKNEIGELPKNINWTAPEVLVDSGNEICELADVWSLAVVAAEILSGEIPFDSPHCRQLTIEAFVDALGNNLRPGLPAKAEDWMRDAIHAGWQLDVEKRCSAEHLRAVFDSHLNDDWSLENDRKKHIAAKYNIPTEGGGGESESGVLNDTAS